MAVNLAHPDPRAQRQDWSSRTTDLDGSTEDLLGESTADIYGVRTQDVDETHARETDSAPAPSAPAAPDTPRVVTCDLAPVQETQDETQSPPPPVTSPPAHAATVEAEVKVPAIAAGTILNDRYLLEKALGAGGTALVFSARDLQATQSSPRARVAVKIPRPDAKDRARAVSRIQHEFRHAQNLTHPSIVQVFDLENDEHTWFMTMELIEGKSLAAMLRNWPSISETMKRSILRSCADALIYAHSCEIVHGDFKPANVLVDAQGQAKVFDFGAASAANVTSGEDTRIAAGTPAYASPQVLSGLRPERRDDVFSFACVAYELLTGQHPFERRSSLEARAEGRIPPRAWNLSASQWLALLSALSWEREQRPADIEALMESLFAPEPVPEEPAVLAEAPVSKSAVAELPDEIIASQRGWGFFAFVAIAVSVLFFLAQRDRDEVAFAPQSEADTRIEASAAGAAEPTAPATQPSTLMASMPLSSTPRDPDVLPSTPSSVASDEPRALETAPPAPRPAPAAPPSTIGFTESSIVTSESSISAVFVVKRTGSLSGRSTVQWTAKAGTAKPDEDFIAGSGGTVEFADGQAQRAIYIPLRNDTVPEEDETFTVELSSPQRARLGEISRIEATIRDDD